MLLAKPAKPIEVKMSKRNAALHAAAASYRKISDDLQNAQEHARQLVIDLLSPDLRTVYNYALSSSRSINTADIRDLGDWSNSYASSLLKELWEVGLLGRNEVVDTETRYFLYFVNSL